MDIVVQQILTDNQIIFSSPWGNAIKGTWKDGMACIGHKYAVELDLPQKITVADISLGEPHSFIRANNDMLEINGVLVEYGNDGYGEIRLGDSIIQFDSDKINIQSWIGTFVKITVKQIDLYDEHIV